MWAYITRGLWGLRVIMYKLKPFQTRTQYVSNRINKFNYFIYSLKRFGEQ